jgi:transposase-like protein
MYRIALNVAISFYRRESARTQCVISDETRVLEAAGEMDSRPEDVQVLYRFIDGLDALNKALILLYLDEQSYREIADVLGISETNVATKINRLKNEMRRNMELDAMKARWAEYDRKLDFTIRLNRELLLAGKIDRVRTPLRRFAALAGAGALFGLAVLVALGNFIYGHRAEPRFALPGVLLQVWSVAMLAASVRMTAMALRIDYERPVAEIQNEIERLRALRIRVTQWALLTGQVVWWTPFLIVALEGFWGVDAYQTPGAGFLAVNVAFGLALIPVAVWVSRRLGGHAGGSPALRWLTRELGGYNLNAAEGFLAEVRAFSEG